ncbi:hypothetical protein OJAV_G00102810 [Oryzias javanicus]|uniref:Integrase catalytic domain-containing protein n=1 Tax=Oryzias javanicus TaxID=123683 RepID=A0A3S2UBM6_ORYJA|nr:hypothetical protein OJAV_G00102810 [Oryzias javanicus]
MEEELCCLLSQVELQRMQTTVIATLKGERAALERDRDALRSSVDALRSAQRKGGNFESELLSELLRLSGVAKSHTTAYHPMGNGGTERFNRTLGNMIRALPLRTKQDWPQQIQTLTFAYNATVHETTGFAPFYLMFGRVPRLPVDVLFRTVLNDSDVTDFSSYSAMLLTNFADAAKVAQQHATHQQEHQAKGYNKKVKSVALQIGDRVLLANRGVCGQDGGFEARQRVDDGAAAAAEGGAGEAAGPIVSQLGSSIRRLEELDRELEGRLQAQQREWLASQAELLAHVSGLKAELSASQLERTRLEGELSGLRETNQSLDLSNARLTSQYQVTGAKQH